MGGLPNGDALPKLALAGAAEKTPAPPVEPPKIFAAGFVAEVLAFPPKIFAADGEVCVTVPPKMLAACPAAGGLVAALPKIDCAEDVCDEKVFDVPNASPENKLPLAFSDTFGLQIEKSLKIEPTSDEAVAVAAGVDVKVDVADDCVPNPPKTDPGFEWIVGSAKLNAGEVAAVDGVASLASDLTETIDGVADVATDVGEPNGLLANGDAVLLVAVVFAVEVNPYPLKIEDVSVAEIGVIDGFSGAELSKMLAGELVLVLAVVVKLKDVTGDATADDATAEVDADAVFGASDTFARLIGVAAIGFDALDENTKLVDGDAIDAADFTGAGEMSNSFGDADFVESNAFTMLGDSAAIETFSVVSFVAGGVAETPNMGIVLAACPNTVNGFCIALVEFVDFGVANDFCAKLKTGSEFSDGTFSLLPTIGTDPIGLSTSTISLAVFVGLLNEKTGVSTLAGSVLRAGGDFSTTIGFVVGLNVNEVCDWDLLTPNVFADGGAFDVTGTDTGSIETVVGTLAMLALGFIDCVGPNVGFGSSGDWFLDIVLFGTVLNDGNGPAVDLIVGATGRGVASNDFDGGATTTVAC